MTELATKPVSNRYVPTTDRRLTSRGVMWLGQTCNLRCHFCYFLDRIEEKTHPEHPFMSVEKAKAMCDVMRHHYGNTAVDIQGGEPTLFKGIAELISHCASIGLAPTLITNAIALSSKRRMQEIADAGVRDLLVSVQGLGETYDSIVQVKGVHTKQAEGIANAIECGVPLRFNCVLSKPALHQLDELAKYAVECGVEVVNFLAFNPFNDQKLPGKRSVENVPRYHEIKGPLQSAISHLEENEIEVNVRYLPLCILDEPFRKNVYTFRQLPYDAHEWDYASWSWTGGKHQLEAARELSAPASMERSTRRFQSTPEFISGACARTVRRFTENSEISATSMTSTEELYQIHARGRAEDNEYAYASACGECSVREICDGFHGDYAAMFGADEAKAIKLSDSENPSSAVTNPKYFIQHQTKRVHPDEF